MPRISWFYGIAIYMYYADHEPPHLHAIYGDAEALITLEGSVLRGALPRRALRLVRTWTNQHQDELAVQWDRARRGEQLGTIEPLE